VSVADRTPPMLEVLKEADSTFKEIPHISHHNAATSYMAKGGLRVDFVTPNQGADTDRSQDLPALQTAAEPLRFLDFLIHETEDAVVLHGSGIYVKVPAPERYAVHKLILATRRRTGTGKRDKDLHQAEVLIESLAGKRPQALKQVWEEAYGRGKGWRAALLTGMSQLAPVARDVLLKTLNRTRETIPGIDLAFNSPSLRYDPRRDIVQFVGEALGRSVECGVTGEALTDHFGADGLDRNGRIDAVRKNRSQIEQLLRKKYLSSPVDGSEVLLLKTTDVTTGGSSGHPGRHQD
jgi:hypothetical protein